MYVLQTLAKTHDKAHFSCGEPLLDTYIRHQAGQDQRRNVAQVYVLTEEGNAKVIGFYTLSSSSIQSDFFSEDVSKRLPMYPIPTILLGRLGVDESQKGKRLGKLLLMDALHKTLEASENIGVFALEVKAKHNEAAQFYQKYGFEALEDDALRLFLPVKRIIKILNDS